MKISQDCVVRVYCDLFWGYTPVTMADNTKLTDEEIVEIREQFAQVFSTIMTSFCPFYQRRLR